MGGESIHAHTLSIVAWPSPSHSRTRSQRNTPEYSRALADPAVHMLYTHMLFMCMLYLQTQDMLYLQRQDTLHLQTQAYKEDARAQMETKLQAWVQQ